MNNTVTEQEYSTLSGKFHRFKNIWAEVEALTELSYMGEEKSRPTEVTLAKVYRAWKSMACSEKSAWCVCSSNS